MAGPKNLIIRRDVQVAGTPGRALRTLPRGTALEEIAEVDLAQLHPDHFVQAKPDGDGGFTRTDDQESWKPALGERLSKLAADLRALDDSPGVDSTEHVDPKEATAR